MKRVKNLVPVVLSVLALTLAGCGGGDDGDTGGGDAGGGSGAASDTISVVGTDDLKWSETELRATAGEVTVNLTCEEAVNHNFVIEELDDELVVECDPGASATGTVELEAGTYTYYCNIAGHREAGMEGTLTVEG